VAKVIKKGFKKALENYIYACFILINGEAGPFFLYPCPVPVPFCRQNAVSDR
jgi:hypothetical protein